MSANNHKTLLALIFCRHDYIKEDEYHFLLACPHFRDLRQKYSKRYYYTWSSIHKFIALMNSKSPSVINNISKFLIEAFDRRNTILA